MSTSESMLQMAGTLLVILAASELFTNALEHLGERLGISEGLTGSVFAAVGTALPETMVPILALLDSTAEAAVNEEVGVGAILGAPLMLSTLSTALMGLSVIGRRGPGGQVRPERGGHVRDLNFFLVAFAIAAAALYLPEGRRELHAVLAAALVGIYIFYLVRTMRASRGLVEGGHGTQAPERMWLSRLGMPEGWIAILLQLSAALALLVYGAKGFIHGVEGLARILHVSPLLLSLIVIPIATELPEKVNSILWIRRGKDTLAFGNITGAMVFQGTLLPAIGILLTPWQPRIEVLGGIVITIAAAAWLRLVATRHRMPVWALFVNGALYATYLWITLGR